MCHLQKCQALPWHAKVGVYFYTFYNIHYDTFYFWLIDFLDISCFTSTGTIVSIDIGSKFKGGGSKSRHPHPVLTPVIGEGCKGRTLDFCVFWDIFVMVHLLWHRTSVLALLSHFHWQATGTVYFSNKQIYQVNEG